MKTLTYSELSKPAQIEAFRQAMAMNPIETRTKSISDLLETYEYNYHGMIIVQPEPLKEVMTPRTEKNRQFRDHLYSENF